GNKIKTILGKDFGALPNCGETWEISGVEGNISEVSEGPLSGKKLTDLIDRYKEGLVGEKVYQNFKNEFPLLIKFLDANDDLSIQVHPDDKLAKERHNSFGKTEMWYILQADKGAKLNTGFSKDVTEEEYLTHLKANTLDQILNFEEVQKGDVYFLPAGRVHYIGKGVCLAEIQQTSDITYRIYDFDRVDDKGNKRELHTEEALAAIDYKYHPDYKTKYTASENERTDVVKSQYFDTGIIKLTQPLNRDLSKYDSFTIYVCPDGDAQIQHEGGNVSIKKGESVLVPASIQSVKLIPNENTTLLEVFVP
ncbi:MAG TPA: type I phosphomannose isomerase catalytic subunit, partial [Cytophagaceae bacterium]